MTTETHKVAMFSSRESVAVQCNGEIYNEGPYILGTIVENSLEKGDNYPDWKYRLKNGLQCTTFMSGTKYSRSETNTSHWASSFAPNPPWNDCAFYPWLATVEGKTYGLWPDYGIGVPDANQQLSWTSADNAAKTAFIEKVRSVQTSFNGGTFLGELNESLRMLASPAKSLRKGFDTYLGALKKERRKVRRLRPRLRLPAARKILAETWLEYSFGWKPLVNDIDDAMKLLADSQITSIESRRPVRASGRDQIFGGSVQRFTGDAGHMDGFAWWEHSSKKEVRYYGQVDIEHPQPAFATHSGNFLEDFVPTVWELIPYSFLADYFTNIGDIINAATYLRSKLRWVGRTEYTVDSSRISRTMGQARVASDGVIRFRCSPLRDKYTKVTFSRAPYTGSLVPTLEFTIPGFGTKWINMAALLTGNRALVPFHR